MFLFHIPTLFCLKTFNVQIKHMCKIYVLRKRAKRMNKNNENKNLNWNYEGINKS